MTEEILNYLLFWGIRTFNRSPKALKSSQPFITFVHYFGGDEQAALNAFSEAKQEARLYKDFDKVEAFKRALTNRLLDIFAVPFTYGLYVVTEKDIASTELFQKTLEALPDVRILYFGDVAEKLKRARNLKYLLEVIPLQITTLQLSHCLDGSATSDSVRAIFAHLPCSIRSIRLDGIWSTKKPGFFSESTNISPEDLAEIVASLPRTIQKVHIDFLSDPNFDLATYFAELKKLRPPLKPAPVSYAALFPNHLTTEAELMQGARAMLDDYTKGNNAVKRFFHGHWKRHHVVAVNKIVDYMQPDRTDWRKITTLDTLRRELNKIKPENPNGSLARRIRYINQRILLASQANPRLSLSKTVQSGSEKTIVPGNLSVTEPIPTPEIFILSRSSSSWDDSEPCEADLLNRPNSTLSNSPFGSPALKSSAPLTLDDWDNELVQTEQDGNDSFYFKNPFSN